MMRTGRRLLALAALSSLAVVAAPTARAQTPTVTSVIGAADGLFVDLEIEIENGVAESEEVTAQQLALTFGPEPSVTLPPTGGSVSEQVANVDEQVGEIALTASLLTAAAEGALGPAGFATAESAVADLDLRSVLVPPMDVGAQQDEDAIIAAELISATCSADLSGVSGATTLVGASVLGQTLAVEPEPNTELEIGVGMVGTIGVSLNRQVENPDGSLSVTALVLELDLFESTVTGTLEIGPATCGVVEGLTEPPEEVVPAPAQPLPAAQVRFTG